MGEACSHLSEEERQVIRIEIGNGTSIRRIGLMLGRNASMVGREIERDTWFPSNENESCRPYRPKRLKTGPWTGGCYIAGPAAAQGRPQARRTAQAPPPVMRTPVGRGWSNGWVAAGRRCPSAAGCASCSPTTPPCACARRPSAVGSTPTAIAVNAGRAAFHAATGGVAGVAAGGRRVSRFPDGFPSPSVRRRPETAAVSAIGRPTA